MLLLGTNAEPRGGRPRDPEGAPARFAVVLVLCALAPYLVVVATRFRHSYTPEGDNGTIDLRVRDVWSLHPPLVGPYSTFGWNHPGPLLFYALAIPSLLSGFAAWGTQVGGALLQGLAVAWLAWLAWRRGRLPLLAVTMVGVGLLALATIPVVVRNPWNPYVPLPFFVLFVFQAWLIAAGDARALPGATVVATFLVQTHVGYAPLVAAAVAVAAAYFLLDLRRGNTSDQRWGRALRWSVAIGAVLWLPPILDVILRPPGNLRVVARYFLHPERSVLPRIGLEQNAAPGDRVRADPAVARRSRGHRVRVPPAPADRCSGSSCPPSSSPSASFTRRGGATTSPAARASSCWQESSWWLRASRWHGPRATRTTTCSCGAPWSRSRSCSEPAGRSSPVVRSRDAAGRIVGAVAAVAVLCWGSVGLAIDMYHASTGDLPAERQRRSLAPAP